jgi:hypothetical protein
MSEILGKKAIRIIQASRQTHVNWAEYFEKYPEAEQIDVHKNIGDAKFHRECIANYDEAIAEIEQMIEDVHGKTEAG